MVDDRQHCTVMKDCNDRTRFDWIMASEDQSSAICVLRRVFSFIIFLSLVVFTVEVTIVNNQHLQTIISTDGSLGINRKMLIINSVIVCWCAQYTLVIVYLIAYRGSVMATIVHCVLAGSYWILFVCWAKQYEFIPLSVFDQFAVLVQLSLGIVFVIMKLNKHFRLDKYGSQNLLDQPEMEQVNKDSIEHFSLHIL